MKVCSKCKIEKEDTDFNWRFKHKNIRQSACKICQSEATKKHYQNNSAIYKKRAKNYRIKVQSRFMEWLSNKECIDCKENDPIVLDCDHIRDKKFSISKMVRDAMPWDTILDELSKCEIRCANCHRKKTAKQFGWKVRI